MKLLKSIIVLQSYERKRIAIQKVNKLRRQKSSIIIQKYFRMYIIKYKFIILLKSIIKLQYCIRRWILYKKIIKVKRNKAVLYLQKNIKKFLVQKEYIKYKKKIIILQSLYRKRIAINERKRLNLEKRDVITLQKNNNILKEKYEQLKLKLKNQFTEVVNKLHYKIDKSEQINKELKSQLEITRKTKRDTLIEIDKMVTQITKEKDDLNKKLANQLNRLLLENEKLKREKRKKMCY